MKTELFSENQEEKKKKLTGPKKITDIRRNFTGVPQKGLKGSRQEPRV